SADGRLALSGADDNTVRLWDLETRKFIRSLNGHSRAVYGVAFSPDGRRAVSGGKDCTLRLWKVDTGAALSHFDLPAEESIWGVAVSSGGRHVLIASDSSVVRLWDAETSKEVGRLEGHADLARSVAVSTDGRWAITSGGDAEKQRDYTIRLWDIARRTEDRQ